MTFLPIVERELRVASRLPKTHRDRWLNAASVLGLFLLIYTAEYRTASPARLGQTLFHAFSAVMFVGSLFYCFVTADSISSEKRDGTLGLLFLTDLRGYDIVFGKLAASSLSAFYNLLACLPVLSLPLLMGGVSGADFCRMMLAVLNALFLSVSAGILVSAGSWHGRKALVGAGVLVTLLAVGIPWLEHDVFRKGVADADMISRFISPSFAFVQVMGRRSAVPAYWDSLAAVHLLGWLFLVGAFRLIHHQWQEKPLTAVGTRWAERLTIWSLGDTKKRRACRMQMFTMGAPGPVCWLDDRYRLQKSFLWAVLLAFAVMWMWNFDQNPMRWIREEVVLVNGLLLHYGLLVWIAFQAAHRFIEDRASGALELLLATPLNVREIIAGRLSALRRQFAWPIIAVLAFDVFMVGSTLALELWTPRRTFRSNDDVLWLCGCFGGILMLVINVWAVSWVGLWIGMKARKIGGATLGTVARVLILHWVCFIATMAIAVTIWPRQPGMPLVLFLVVGNWFGWGLFCSLFFGLLARRKLLQEFRELAVHRFDAPAEGWFGRWKHRKQLASQRALENAA
jgi:ABC-type transport system involved in multi-copper enzyme maturation permease subunit